MMLGMRGLVLASILILSVQQAPFDPEPGISEALAHDRAARISNLRYDLAFTIPAARAEPISGRALIRFALKSADGPVVLDYQPDKSGFLRAVEANGRETKVRQVNGHIIVPADAVRVGDNAIALDFNAGDVPLNRSEDFLYTIFVPARAHQAFPCFDQPDLKARWTLALDVPEGWETIGNGEETRRDSRDGRTRIAFSETQPLPTYLFAFGAGRFLVESAE